MKSIFILIVFMYIPNFLSSQTFDISKLKVALQTDQIMIVVPLNKDSYSANFYYYIKRQNVWFEYFQSEAHIGYKGLGKQKEGDQKTPQGIFKFNSYFGIADNPGTKLPYIKLNNSLYWNGDSNSDRYNQMVNIETYQNFDKSKSEHLIDETLAYQYAMNINYNEEGIPYKGSAIFLHCYTKNPYTAGCVALPYTYMESVLKNVSKNARIIIDLKENIYNY